MNTKEMELKKVVEEKENENQAITEIKMDAKKDPQKYVKNYKIPAEGE